MNLLSQCKSAGYLKKEYVFLALIVTLMVFSFLGSIMTFQNFFTNNVTLEGYSDKIEEQAKQEQAKQEQAKQEQEQAKSTQHESMQSDIERIDIDKPLVKREIYMGIPRSQIPKGHEDLYIRKSQVVPPVCPECPPLLNQDFDEENDKCPPCASCKRCPEPAFICKEIPSDSSNPSANAYLPRPLLTNFGKFGL